MEAAKMLESVNTKINEIFAKELFHINYLSSYPVSDVMLECWAQSIIDLEPEITPEILRWIIDRAKVGFIEWDSRKGIQNIFNGFRVFINYKIKEETKESSLKGEYPKSTKWNILYVKYRNSKFNEL